MSWCIHYNVSWKHRRDFVIKFAPEGINVDSQIIMLQKPLINRLSTLFFFFFFFLVCFVCFVLFVCLVFFFFLFCFLGFLFVFVFWGFQSVKSAKIWHKWTQKWHKISAPFCSHPCRIRNINLETQNSWFSHDFGKIGNGGGDLPNCKIWVGRPLKTRLPFLLSS